MPEMFTCVVLWSRGQEAVPVSSCATFLKWNLVTSIKSDTWIV